MVFQGANFCFVVTSELTPNCSLEGGANFYLLSFSQRLLHSCVYGAWFLFCCLFNIVSHLLIQYLSNHILQNFLQDDDHDDLNVFGECAVGCATMSQDKAEQKTSRYALVTQVGYRHEFVSLLGICRL